MLLGQGVEQNELKVLWSRYEGC